MRRQILYFASMFLLVAFSVFSPFLSSSANAATSADTQNAKKFCQAVRPAFAASAETDCESGYISARAIIEGGGTIQSTGNNSVIVKCDQNGSISNKGACDTGFNAGATGNTSPTNTSSAISTICSAYSGTKQNDCQQVLAAQCSGYVPATVNSSSAANAKHCFDGAYAKLQGQASPCKGLKGAAATACNGGFSNTSAPTNGSGSTQTGNNSNNLTCDLEFTNALTWAICPIVDALVKVVDLVDEQITDALTVNTASIFCTGSSASNSTCNAYYGAWQSFRNIALGLLAIAGLVILISQALGFEVLDAYTIKKALPRLLVAAIMITLSWPLMEFFVGFTNDLGFGIRHLIYAPFANIKANINLDFNGGITNILFGGAATGAAAVAAVPIWIAAGGIGVLLAYVATAALAVLVAFVVLVLRQVAIILLIIMAPVAIVCYILPNTERIYKFWWESFSKALLMFPLIAGFIAAGRVFSAVALQNSDNPVSGFLGFAAYFAPYFLIPATFKLAGGAIRQIGGFVNDRSRGGFDRLRQYRGNQAKNRVERARKGGLYRKDFGQFNRPFKRDAQGNRVKSSVGRVLNKVGDYTLDADEVVPMKLGSTTLGGALSRPGIPGFRRGAARDISLIDQARRDQTAKAFQEIDPGYKAGRLLAGEFGYYNDGLQAADRASLDENYGIKDGKGNITGYRNPDGYGERMQVAQMFSRSGNLEGREAAAELAAAAPVIEKFSQSAETARVDGRLLGLMAAAKDGRLEIDDIVNNHNRQMVSGMTPDQAIQETTMLQNLATQKRVSAARGHGIEYDENGRAYNVYKEAVDSKGNVIGGPLSEKAQNSLARVNSGELAQVKSEDIDAWAETMVAGASEYEMEMRKDAEGRSTGKVMFRGEGADKNDLVPKTGIAAQRAKEVQNRIKYLAQYSQGDSDVGRKIRGVWERIGGDPSALEWGTARTPMDPSNPTGAPGPEPEQPPEQQ